MKNYCLILITFLLSFYTNAQNQQDILFSAQMQGLLIDVTNNFEHFKGTVIDEKDSIALFTSKMTLPGTTKNEISTNNKGSFYTAVIATGLNEKMAADLGKIWKEKLINVIGKGYEEMPFDTAENKVVRHGYMMVQDNYSVTIHWLKKESEETFIMYLMIMHLN